MADTYKNYEDLAAHEVEDKDYRVTVDDRELQKIVIAIHGGGIEGGTSELAKAFAEDTHSSLYLFEGIKSSGNTALHITSTHFDEPRGLEAVSNATLCLSFHGYSSTTKHTLIGGADTDRKQRVFYALQAAGFSCELVPDDSKLAGREPDNIVNKSQAQKGVQLELSTAQRQAMFSTFTLAGREGSKTAEFVKYLEAVKNAYAGV
ncbi:putative poly-gamma-glutamate hydrolase [Phage f2b1]|nr:putative poly-gamma-glutamate hydrolase [Phage f2b1]